MGYRIELEEIEAALNALPSVKESAAIYQRVGDGLGQILAFVATNCAATAEELLRELSGVVPPYMLPRRIVLVNELPKNANGKIDRTVLHGAAAG